MLLVVASKVRVCISESHIVDYREAVANEQTDIRLKLSHFYINESNAADCHSIWKHNTSTVISLDIDREEFIGEQFGMPASRYEFDLSSSHKLQSFELSGEWIGFKGKCMLCIIISIIFNIFMYISV
ncbi:hypothetical protein DPMN_158793 [Dreissena polymorpha]|uniref:Uncharacterized protein n=1 Tax=Dreissena polymorpha TaxID=45954 RepID=A0A9D4EJS6_DREPO|nr:hypothetical protein DPMN_158793 [Dreissena polymorpha]